VGLFGNGAKYWPTPPADQPIIRRKPLASCLDLAKVRVDELEGGKATRHQGHLFFLKPSDVISSASSCLLPKPHQHAFGSATQSGPSRAALEPPSGVPRSTRSTRSTIAPVPIPREALPGRVRRWSCADGVSFCRRAQSDVTIFWQR
jgi:hypothetical protein